MHKQAIFFTKKPDIVERNLPKKSIQGLLIPVRYADQQFEKAVKGVKMCFCRGSPYVKKRQRASGTRLLYSKKKQFVCCSTFYCCYTKKACLFVL